MRTRIPLALSLAAGLAMTPPAIGNADVPLRSITLYRSGVGSFEHTGTVRGAEHVRLRFDADKLNDILKSMVLLDLDGGRVDGAAYQPNEPLERRLQRFRINPKKAGDVIGLLSQIQGSQVRIRTASGDISGTVLGVEMRPISIGGGSEVTRDHAVNLLTDAGVQTVMQADIRSFEILDEELASELKNALAAVAQHRDDRWTDIDLHFRGEGERRVAIAYTHEAPVWKTSYRLILPNGTSSDPTIQGWAIVENDTGADWTDVNLSLASGRPVSFVMDLQTPLILKRPNVPVPAIASLGPQVYESGFADRDGAPGAAEFSQDAADARSREAARATALQSRAPDSGAVRSQFRSEGIAPQQAAATAGDLGEQFIYTLDAPVTIRRNHSAMLPILGSTIEGRRMTIYSAQNQNALPMRGVELTNNTGLDLMPGPISVYDSGAYAGDAQIEHLARRDARLLSYAADHDLNVKRETKTQNDVRRVRIVNGMIERTHSSTRSVIYTFSNSDTDPRLVLLEHPKQSGWEILGETTPNSETESLYRFEIPVNAGDTLDFSVDVQRVWRQQVAVTDMNLDELVSFTQTGKASQAVLDAVKKAASMQRRINDLEQDLNRLRSETNEIAGDQARIRSNMNSIDRRSDLYTRYMQTLEEQENRLEQIRSQRRDLERHLDAAREELRAFLSDLNVR